MQTPQVKLLPDGRRLHLQHGPIDLIVEAWGAGQQAAYQRAAQRFETILQELVVELPALRRPMQFTGPEARISPARPRPGVGVKPEPRVDARSFVFAGATARRMAAATAPFAAEFVTPMAAVAGAVADEILASLIAPDMPKAYVNNGGDIALHLTPGEHFTTALAGTDATATITADMAIGGIATSGWHGRSHSLGIADAVTVLARTAAQADAAATLIANAVDLPHHPGITRHPANSLSPDSDLGDTAVTTAVPPLTHKETAQALHAGLARAEIFHTRSRIVAAHLSLQGASCHTATDCFEELAHA